MAISLIIACGLFVMVILKDRFDGLRYLLNFAGIQSFSYKLGLLLADFTLYLIMAALFIVVGLILGIDSIIKHSGDYMVVMAMFGFSFISMNYCFCYLIAPFLKKDPSKAAEQGFKYSILPNLLFFVAGTLI